jgi:hypothetical protein
MDVLILSPTSVKPVETAPSGDTSPVHYRNNLTFTEGQVVEASVQRIINSLVWLDVGGRTLIARTEVPLQAQQCVSLKVAEADPARITLQVVNHSAASPLSPAAKRMEGWELPPSPSSNLSNLLISWGIDADDVNLVIAKALLKYGQTLTSEDVQSVRTLWRTLENQQPGDLEALAHLYTNQLPAGKEALELAHRLLNGPILIASRLSDLQFEMGEALSQLHLVRDRGQTLERLIGEIKSALTQMESWSISSELPLEELTARLAGLVVNLGEPPESELANRLLSTDMTQMPVVIESTEPPVPSLKGSGQAEASAPSRTRLATQETIRELDNPLYRLVSALSDALSNADLDEATARALRRLEDHLDLLSKDLGAIHLSNLTDTPDLVAGQRAAYLFPIPIATPHGPRTAHLKVYRRPESHRIDPENMQLSLLLDLPALGEIVINLSVLERCISGQILSSSQQTHHLVEIDLSSLRKSLNALGYHVNLLTCDLLKAEDGAAPTPRATVHNEIGSLTQIDLSI